MRRDTREADTKREILAKVEAEKRKERRARRRVQDQGEWERCWSYRRMFVALLKTRKDFQPVLHQLFAMADRFPERLDLERIKLAKTSLSAPLSFHKDDRAHPAFMALCHMHDVFERAHGVQPGMQAGERVLCTVIRQVYPQAPDGFRRVGDLAGRQKQGTLDLVDHVLRKLHRVHLDESPNGKQVPVE